MTDPDVLIFNQTLETFLERFMNPRRHTLAEGCCSAIEPCSHQQRDPTTICETCQKAAEWSNDRDAKEPRTTAGSLD